MDIIQINNKGPKRTELERIILCNGKNGHDQIAGDILNKLKGDEVNSVRMAVALMPYENDAEYIITFWNNERKVCELLGGKLDNDDKYLKSSMNREYEEELTKKQSSKLKTFLDEEVFHKKLGITPPSIGDLFGKYFIKDIRRKESDEIKITNRLMYVYYIDDYGELPESPLDKKYTKIERIHWPTYHERIIKQNDLSVVTIKVCEDLIRRVKNEGYKFGSKKLK